MKKVEILSDYKPSSYWNKLLGHKFDYSAVSHPMLSNNINKWAYRERAEAFQRVLNSLNLNNIQGKRVLDVGSGVGFWIGYLKNLGVSDVTGIDISKDSIRVLRSRYPKFKFRLLNISDKSAVQKLSRKFDLVMAMDVILHIVDGHQFSQALKNLCSLTSDNGYLILMEPVIINNSYEEYQVGQSSRARRLSEYRSILRSRGFDLVEVRSVSFLLNNPIEAKTEIGYKLLKKIWIMLGRLDAGNNLRGSILGFTTYWIDRMLLNFLTSGPTSKVIVARKIK